MIVVELGCRLWFMISVVVGYSCVVIVVSVNEFGLLESFMF